MIDEMKRNIINHHARRLKDKTSMSLEECFDFMWDVIDNYEECDSKRERQDTSK